MASAALPSRLHDQLDQLATHQRFWRVISGIGICLLGVTLVAALAIGLDAWLGLSRWIRCGLFGAWIAWTIGLVWIWLVRPMRDTGSRAELAAAVEREYPKLDERLQTTIEVTENVHPGHGSPQLIAYLARETEQRAKKLDFTQAVPTTKPLVILAVGTLILCVSAVAIVIVPGAGDRVRRFLLPFTSPVTEAPYEIVVTSGNAAVRIGDTVTLAGYVKPRFVETLVPQKIFAVVRHADGREERLTMGTEQQWVYTVRRGPVQSDFDYHLEIDDVSSLPYRISAIEPIELAGETSIQVVAPEYIVKVTEATPAYDGFVDLNVWQHSEVTFQLHASRVPVQAWIDWTPKGGKPLRVPVKFNAERQATYQITAIQSGMLGITFEAEQGIRTEVPPLQLTIRRDEAPKFQAVTGAGDQTRAVRPSDAVPITFTVTDDLAISEVVLEYRLNDGPIQQQAIPNVKGIGSVQATAAFPFQLPSIQEGSRIWYRLKAMDNRQLPATKLGPQATYFPAEDKWSELRLDKDAEGLREQEIKQQHQQLRDKLAQLIKDIDRENRQAYKLKMEAKRQAILEIDTLRNLQNLAQQVRESTAELQQLARDSAMVPELKSLAQQMEQVAEQPLRKVNDALRDAEGERDSTQRNNQFQQADEGLTKAIEQLEALNKANEKLAQDRQDLQKLNELAQQQKALAEQAEKATPQDKAELERQQRELQDELDRLTEKSEPLRQAVEALKQDEIRELGEKAKNLAQEQRDLAQAMKQNDQADKQNRLADLERLQEKLAKQLKEFAEKNDPAARAAQARNIDPEAAQQAEKALEKGDFLDALKKQEKAALDLERLANDLEKAAARSSDPKEAARQLARLQDDLRQRVAQATKSTTLDKLPAAQREAFQKEQDAIRRAAEALSLPPKDEQARDTQKNAADFAKKAGENVLDGKQAVADALMQRTSQALQQLADRLPSAEQRSAQARAELARLRQQQEQLARQADALAKEKAAPEKMDELAKRQADLMERLEKLDTPNQEARRDRAAEALKNATDDLKARRNQDIAGSQQEAKRQMDRLEQALAGQRPVDEQAAELARKQKEIAQDAAKLAQLPKNEQAGKMNEMQRRQAEVARQAQAVPNQEAPQLQAEAAEATQQADKAAKMGGAEELAKQAEKAQQALEKLAEQLKGKESAAERADRLAKKAKDQAQQATARGEQAANLNQQAAERQKLQQLVDEAKQLRGEEAQAAKQQAVQALEKAQKLAQQNANSPQQAQARKDAGEALDELAKQLRREPAEAPMQPEPPADAQKLTREQAQQAKELAQQQRQLREEVLKAMGEKMKPNPMAQPMNPMNPMNAKGNPLQNLLEKQNELAQEADKLAKQMKQEKGQDAPMGEQPQQAAQAAKNAGEQLRNGSVEQAQEAGRMAAQRLEQMAQNTPGEAGKQARDLAQKQEELNRQLEPLKQNNEAAQAQQQARQQQLRQQAQDLGKSLDQSMKGMRNPHAEEARQAAQQAQQKMEQAAQQGERGQNGGAETSREQAAQALDKAAQQTMQAAQDVANNNPSGKGEPGKEQAGQALRQAQESMQQAQRQLGQGEPQKASPSMQQAAQQLSQAMQQLGAGKQTPGPMTPGQANGPQEPGGNTGEAGNVPPTLKALLGDDAEKYAGKSWGELPGELKTKVMQDMKARYGDESSKVIKYYFEQLAERK